MAGKRAKGEGTIRQRSNGQWEARYSDPVTGTQKSIYGKKQEDVKKKLDSIKYSIANGIYVEPNKVTLNKWLDVWLFDYKKQSLKPSTFQSYEQIARCYLRTTLGNKCLKDIRTEHVQKMLNDLSKKGLAPRTVKSAQQVLHASLVQAIKNDLLIKNVAEYVTLPKHTKKEMRVLTPQEQKLFVNEIKKERYYLPLVLALATGVRVGELLGLRWCDFDDKEEIIRIQQTIKRVKNFDTGKSKLIYGTPKTEKGKRTIPLLKDICRLVNEHKKQQKVERLKAGDIWQDMGKIQAQGEKWKDNDLIFRTELGKAVEPNNLDRIIKNTITIMNNKIASDLGKTVNELLESEKVKSFGLHTLRHTFATRALERGMQPKVVQEILGHANISMTLDTYSHVLPDTKKESMQLMNDLFIGISL